MTWKANTGHFNLAGHRTFELGLDREKLQHRMTATPSPLAKNHVVKPAQGGLYYVVAAIATKSYLGKRVHVVAQSLRWL